MAEELCRSYREATNLLNEASPDALLVVCQHLKIAGYETIEGKKEAKMSLLRRITRFLNSNDIEKEADQGTAIFKEICILLGTQSKEDATKPNIISDQTPSRVPPSHAAPPLIQVTRRDLKISGQIGEPGQKDRLSYSSLIHQVEGAVKKGHSDEEIIEAVIRAVVPGSALRSYLEGRGDLTLPVLRRMLRAHFQEKGATDLYHRLSSLTQDHRESAQSFLVRALDLRQKIIFTSKEAGSGLKYDQMLVQSMFLHALMTGLRSEAVKSEMRPLLENSSVTDEELFEKTNEAAGREIERQQKLGSSTRKAGVSNIDHHGAEEKAQGAQEKPKPREGTLMTEIAELRAGMADVAVIRKQLSDMQEAMRTGKPSLNAGQPTWRRPACSRCQQDNTRDTCDHCFRCGSSEHFARGCRKRNQNRTGNGERLLPRDEQ